MRIMILTGILALLCIRTDAAEQVVSITVSNVEHQLSIPAGWTKADRKDEWRKGPKGEELISLYLAPEKTLREAVAGRKAAFDRMFTPRNISTEILEDSAGTEPSQWSYAAVATATKPQPPRTLRYLRVQMVSGQIFYLQYTRVLQENEKVETGKAGGKRLVQLWKAGK